MKQALISIVVAIALVGCGKGNPLLEIPEGQFKLLFAHRLAGFMKTDEPSCLEKIHFPDRVKPQYILSGRLKVDSGPADKQISHCLDMLQKDAASPLIGIKDNITYEHIRDSRVKDRAIALGVLKL